MEKLLMVITDTLHHMFMWRGELEVKPIIVQDENVTITVEEEATHFGLYLRKGEGEVTWIADYENRKTAESIREYLAAEWTISRDIQVYPVVVDSDNGLSVTVCESAYIQACKMVEIMQMYDGAFVEGRINNNMEEQQYIDAAHKCLQDMSEDGLLGIDSISTSQQTITAI